MVIKGKYSQDWFSNNVPNWEKFLHKFAGKPGIRAIEIGSFEGMSARWLLDNILTHPSAALFCIDTFQGSKEHIREGLPTNDLYVRFYRNLADKIKQITILMGQSKIKLRDTRLKLDSFDIAYVDGSHQACDALADGVASFQLLKSGGILIFDDFEWSQEMSLDSPKLGIISFLACFEGQYKILLKDYQVILQKI